MKRTIIGVVIAMVLATIGTVVLVNFVRGAEARALAGLETVEVLVVDRDIPRGTAAESLGSSVTTRLVPANVRADGSVTTLDEIHGRVAAVDLVVGEQVVASRFLAPAQLEAERIVELPPGLQEVTLSLAPQRAMGGRIAPGDTVGLFASFDLRGELDGSGLEGEDLSLLEDLAESSKVILHRLLVTNVQVEHLPPPRDDDQSGPELAPTGNLLITLAVDVPQAERIVFSAEYGSIWLSAQDEDTSEAGSRIRNLRNIYHD